MVGHRGLCGGHASTSRRSPAPITVCVAVDPAIIHHGVTADDPVMDETLKSPTVHVSNETTTGVARGLGGPSPIPRKILA